MNLKLRIWRQKNQNSQGKIKEYPLKNVSSDMSFLEMLDYLNEELINKNEEPVAFESDCREGICGACSLYINGQAHGPETRTTACQLHMRKFKEGQTIYIEPWRAKSFPVIKDLVVDRSALDRIIQAGGYISVGTGSAPDANSLPISKIDADGSMDAASCIGCGACVASCKNSSAMLFVSAKITHLNLLPQGKVEKYQRVESMVKAMDTEGFGNCSNHYECEAVCPKGIDRDSISKMNLDYIRS